jgi:methyl-accepting chemotaxis protein
MKPKTKRILGILLISTAILGWLISLSGLVGVWVARPKVTKAVVSQVEMLKLTLEVTTKGLAVSRDSLAAIISSLETLQGTVEKTAGIVNGTTPFIDSLAQISADNLPKTVEGLRSSLETAQQGAKVIDDALRKVTSIPLLGDWLSDKGYNPTTPLDQGLSQVSEGINTLGETFQGITDNLTNTRSSVEGVQQSIEQMAADIGQVKTNLQDAKQVLADYQDTTQSALDFLNTWGNRLPQLITLLAVVFSVLFIWIAATQLGLFLQGMEYTHQEL